VVCLSARADPIFHVGRVRFNVNTSIWLTFGKESPFPHLADDRPQRFTIVSLLLL
jgi:hypothetical protein